MSEPTPIEKDVQVEDTRRVVVTFTWEALEEIVRREAGVPEGATNVQTEINDSYGDTYVRWEVSLNG